MDPNPVNDNSDYYKFPKEERERVKELHRYGILDTPNEEEFDNITKVATYLCDSTSAHINFLDYDRHWSKSSHGWYVKEIPRDQSICNHTIQQDKYLIVNNLYEDPRFKNYSYVKEKTVQFYAGIVLESVRGYNIGTLCVLDKETRELSDKQLESLQILAEDVESKLELRLRREQLVKEHRSLQSTREQLRSLVHKLSKVEIDQRQQLATDLHDNVGQMLALSLMKIDALQKEQSSSEAISNIKEIKNIMLDTIAYIRELTSDLKPPSSIHNDLVANINWVAEKMEKRGLNVTIEDDEQPKSLDEEIRVTVVQCVRELLLNVIEHTSENEAIVRLQHSNGQLQITVTDEGEGFNPENKEFTPDKEGVFGIFNIQERITLLGGSVNIESSKGEGTKVTLQVPLMES